jgi:hypothetical protein
MSKSKILLGKGFRLDKPKKIDPLILRDLEMDNENRKGHILTIGATRVGKTRLQELFLMQDIAEGRSVVAIDPKGDGDLLRRIIHEAFKAGRQDEVLFVSPFFPEQSIELNILSSHYMEEELISHIVSGIKTDGDDFYYNIALEVSGALVRGKMLVKRHEKDPTPLTISDIADSCHFGDANGGMVHLKNKLEEIGTKAARECAVVIEQVLGGKEEYYAKVTSSLRTVLNQLSVGVVGTLYGKAQNNTFLQRLERGESVILYVQTGSMLVREVSAVMARVTLSMIQSLVGRIYGADGKFNPPLCLHLDEFSNIAYKGVEDMLNKAGGSNCWITAYTQDFADIEAELGRERAAKIVANTNTKIIMRVNDINTANLVSELGGLSTNYSLMLGVGGSINTRETEDSIIKPEHLLRQNPREFHFFGFEGVWKCKAAPVEPAPIKIRLPELDPHKKAL